MAARRPAGPPTHFISSGSSLSSFAGAALAPLFLARGQPDKLVLQEEKMPQWFKDSSLTLPPSSPQALWAARPRPGSGPQLWPEYRQFRLEGRNRLGCSGTNVSLGAWNFISLRRPLLCWPGAQGAWGRLTSGATRSSPLCGLSHHSRAWGTCGGQHG